VKRNFKKYKNRKLYDLDNHKYITLEEIFELVRNGKIISVKDFENKDISKQTLATIIVEHADYAIEGSLYEIIKNLGLENAHN
jgi:polyhydroxyalkanoate synthesis regulator protein